MLNESALEAIINATVFDRNGEKVGKVGHLYVDDRTGKPSWVTVNTGFFGLSESFVPVDETLTAHEERIDVPYDKAHIKDAPRIDADGHLDPSQEEELYRYYDRHYTDYDGMDRDTVGTDSDDAHRLAEPSASAGTLLADSGQPSDTTLTEEVETLKEERAEHDEILSEHIDPDREREQYRGEVYPDDVRAEDFPPSDAYADDVRREVLSDDEGDSTAGHLPGPGDHTRSDPYGDEPRRDGVLTDDTRTEDFAPDADLPRGDVDADDVDYSGRDTVTPRARLRRYERNPRLGEPGLEDLR
jgi:sporulation protein YlmC with PRC-barrel domain